MPGVRQMAGWKERAAKRRDFRRTKGDPVVPKQTPSKKDDKPFEVERMLKDPGIHSDWFLRAHPPGVWIRCGKYSTLVGAKQAMKTMVLSWHYGKEFDYRIVGREGVVK
jgi:hypothetical protein